jgi:hypothetical protein
MNVLSPEFPAATQASLLLREEAFCGWIGQAEPGDRLEYHRGLLAVDRRENFSLLGNADRRELAAIADRALALADEGRLLLVQKRHGPADFSYLALMPKRPSQPTAVAQQALNRSIPAPLDQVTR